MGVMSLSPSGFYIKHMNVSPYILVCQKSIQIKAINVGCHLKSLILQHEG